MTINEPETAASLSAMAANDDFYVVRQWIQENPRTAVKVINMIEDDEVREALLKNWALWRREGQKLTLKDIDRKYDQVLLLCGRSWGQLQMQGGRN